MISAKAVDFCEKELEIRRATRHSDLGRALLNAANAYASAGSSDKALEHYKASLELQSESGHSSEVSQSRTLQAMARVYESRSQFDKALECYVEARDKSRGANDTEMAVILNSIALIYDRQDMYEPALENYEAALAIMRENLPAGHRKIALLLNNMGTVYDSLGKFDQALASYTEALAIWKTPGTGNTEKCRTQSFQLVPIH